MMTLPHEWSTLTSANAAPPPGVMAYVVIGPAVVIVADAGPGDAANHCWITKGDASNVTTNPRVNVEPVTSTSRFSADGGRGARRAQSMAAAMADGRSWYERKKPPAVTTTARTKADTTKILTRRRFMVGSPGTTPGVFEA